MISPMHERDESSTDMSINEMSPGGVNPVRRTHVVSHNWKNIRNAMHVAKNEHMSSVDDFVSGPSGPCIALVLFTVRC